jgi:hypothetical protein
MHMKDSYLSRRWASILPIVGVAVFAAMGFLSRPASADEGGASFWLPGQMSSFSAVPGEAGFSLPLVYYHTSADAGGTRNFAVGGNLVAGLDVRADLVFFVPTYVFAEPVLGAQAAVSLGWAAGRMEVGVDAVITGPQGNPVNLSRSDTVEGGSDLYPMATLKWNRGNSNWLAYAMAGIPVGAYELGRLANIGINHWSLDAGGGYTYLDPQAGHELSIVGGLTYNFENEDTNYQNGVDGHIDWAASQFLNEQLHIGLVGYIYYQLSGDSGSGAKLGDFKSRVYAVGPQAGYFFPVGKAQGYLNLRGYYEFDASKRAEGWNAWLTLSYPFGSGDD